VPPRVEIGDDRVLPPVAVPVYDIAAVSVPEQFGIEPRVIWQGTCPRPDTRRGIVLHQPSMPDGDTIRLLVASKRTGADAQGAGHPSIRDRRRSALQRTDAEFVDRSARLDPAVGIGQPCS
jgi:hypothetical protein